jgi:hypothetical protein
MGHGQCSGLLFILVSLLNRQYSLVLERISPLEEENNRLKANLDVSQAKLNSLTEELQKVCLLQLESL